MEHLIEIVAANWDIILFDIALITFTLVGIIKGEKDVVLKMLFAMVTEAEKTYGSGTGSLKLSSVITSIYPKLPVLIRTFVRVETLQNWIEEVLEEAKKSWEANSNLSKYIEE